MNWIETKERLPDFNEQPCLFIKSGETFKGFFVKRHECHANGLFSAEIDYEDEYFTPNEVDYWLPIPNQPERSKREDCVCLLQEILHDKICRRVVFKEDPFAVYESRMRCSEHCGDTVRDK